MKLKFLLAGLILLFSFTLSAETHSGTCGAEGDNLTWTLDTETGVLTIEGAGAMENYTHNYGYTGNGYVSTSNSPWNDYRSIVKKIILSGEITTIGDAAFPSFTAIEAIHFPDKIQYIGKESFHGCTNIKELSFPSSLAIIGSYSFNECKSLKTIHWNSKACSITEVKYTYGYCDNTPFARTGIETLIIDDMVEDFPYYLFDYCENLKSIIWNAEKFQSNFYSVAKYITSVTIGNNVKDISIWSFQHMENLSLIEVDANNLIYSSIDGVLLDKEEKALLKFPTKSQNIPYTIPNSVTSIGDYAFEGCSSLTSVTIPNSVTSIGDDAFCDCRSLTSITIPNSVTSIGEGAFINCSGLTAVHISDLAAWCKISFGGCCSTNPLTYAHNLYLNGELVKDLVIPNSVTSIGNSAFEGCSSLTSVTIPNSVINIGEWAFSRCRSLTSITIPNSVTSIGDDAFYDCKSLTSVQWNAVHCADFTNASTPFYYYLTTSSYGNYDLQSQITTFTFGNEVEYIPAYLCNNLSNVKDIVLPCSVKGIGENVFNELTTVKRDCGITEKSETYLKLCEGEEFSWMNHNISTVKPSDSGDYAYKTKTILYDDSIVTMHLTVNPVYETSLQSAILCYSEDLYIDGVKCPLSKQVNSWQKWTRNLKTIEGCDSTVTISVKWQKLPDFSITIRHEYDTYNSGSISYKITDSYYSGKYYYTLNGEKGRSLSNLPAGTYRLVFFSEECDDSVEKTVQIYQYGMKVNNQYYLLDTENHTATLTYRGASYSDYSNEYSGNITIPESITFNGQEYKVTGIGASAFSGCSVTSVTMTSKQPVTISNSCGLGSAIVYVPFGSLSDYKKTSYWKNYNLHVINPSHSSSSSSSTSTTITLGNDEEAKHIASCGLEGGEEEFAGNVIEYIGLEPESEYADVPFFVKTKEGDYDIINTSFKTSALELTTLASKAVSNTTSILLAETNMSDSETSCGFEWRRNDQPADMPSNQVLCPVANGLMAGRLKGLKDDVYYKYRAFYKSAAGNMYYGDWQYIFTGDVTVEFDPILYTYAAQFVTERTATVKGYALAGSEDFTEQGFEYWAESRRTDAPARRAPHYELGERHTVKSTGISMRVTLEDLDEGTVYTYRTYAKVGGKTLYGAEMTFTTQGTYEEPIKTDLEQVGYDNAGEDDRTPATEAPQVRKYIRNGILLIERNGKTYTAQGQRID